MEIVNDIATPLLAWYQQHKRSLPWREEPTPYYVWVSEIMLQQTRVEAVKGYFARFVAELPDIPALAAVSEDRLLKLWEGLGYYNRARNLQKAARIIVEQYGGRMPKTYQELLALPGIGSYTAGAIASIAYGQREPAVDGNVLRILSRLLLYEGDILKESSKKEAREALLACMPTDSSSFNQALMELGATVCVPNGAPHCEICPWRDICQAYALDCWQDYPKKGVKKPRRQEDKTVLLIQNEGQFVLHKRPEKGLLAGLYEFPMLEGYVPKRQIVEAVRGLGLSPLRVRELAYANHIFSHVEWHMKGYEVLIEPVEYRGESETLLKAAENKSDETSPAGDTTGRSNTTPAGDADTMPLYHDKNYLLITKEATRDAYPIPSAFKAFAPYLELIIGSDNLPRE